MISDEFISNILTTYIVLLERQGGSRAGEAYHGIKLSVVSMSCPGPEYLDTSDDGSETQR